MSIRCKASVCSRPRLSLLLQLLFIVHHIRPGASSTSSSRATGPHAFGVARSLPHRTSLVVTNHLESKLERILLGTSSASMEQSQILLRLRGGYSSDYRSNDDASFYSYETPQTAGSTRYQEEWEVPATAAARNQYSYPQQSSQQEEEQYHDDDYYNDRGLPTPRERQQQRRRSQSLSSKYLPSILSQGNKKIGLSLLAAGAVVTMLGVSLFFNKALMRLGNLLVIAGVPMTLGPTRTMGYFMQPAKARATACLAAGIFLVFVGWPVFGIALEVFGLLNLFGNMFPLFWAVAKQTPFVGNLLKQNDRNGNGGGSNRRRRYYDDEEDFDRRRREEERYY